MFPGATSKKKTMEHGESVRCLELTSGDREAGIRTIAPPSSAARSDMRNEVGHGHSDGENLVRGSDQTSGIGEKKSPWATIAARRVHARVIRTERPGFNDENAIEHQWTLLVGDRALIYTVVMTVLCHKNARQQTEIDFPLDSCPPDSLLYIKGESQTLFTPLPASSHPLGPSIFHWPRKDRHRSQWSSRIHRSARHDTVSGPS